MKIYTKTGDSGETSLVGGKRVSKACPRVMAYGDLDELISMLGILRCDVEEMTEDNEWLRVAAPLRHIQEVLMGVSAHLAAEGDAATRLKPVDPVEIEQLEKLVDQMTDRIPVQKAFVLPAQPRISSLCHLARTVCRRAERSAVQIESRSVQDEIALKYINRLSDYLFTLARYLCTLCGCEDDWWLP